MSAETTNNRWTIVSVYNEPVVSAPTELEAWQRAVAAQGRCVEMRQFLSWVGWLRGLGFRAVER